MGTGVALADSKAAGPTLPARGLQRFNRYNYVNNNPYKFVDPDECGHAI
jgi:hypothetical protein